MISRSARRTALIAVATLLAVLGGVGQRIDAGARVTATCADFPNQVAAQRAHNTRDGDGDGVCCEGGSGSNSAEMIVKR